MRWILVEKSRRKDRIKHCGEVDRQDLELLDIEALKAAWTSADKPILSVRSHFALLGDHHWPRRMASLFAIRPGHWRY